MGLSVAYMYAYDPDTTLTFGLKDQFIGGFFYMT